MLYGLVLPLAAGLIVTLLARGRAWGMAVALGATYVAADVLCFGVPELAPVRSESWWVHLAAAATLVGIVGWLKPIPVALRWTVIVLLFITAIFVTVRELLPFESWMTWQAAVQCLGLAVGWLVLLWALQQTARRVPGRTVIWVWVAVFALVTFAAFIPMAQDLIMRGLIVLLALLGVGIAASIGTKVQMQGGPTLIVTLLFGLILLHLHLYTAPPFPPWTIAALAACPLLAWVRLLPMLKKRRAHSARLITLAVVALAVLAILSPMAIRFINESVSRF